MKRILAALAFAALAAAGCKAKPAATSVTCDKSLKAIEDKGSSVRIACPEKCTQGSVWGTDTYTEDSSLCTAAIHAGVITDKGGEATVNIKAGEQSYKGSARNGITSEDWGPWQKSFTISK